MSTESAAAWGDQSMSRGVPDEAYETLAQAQAERWGYAGTLDNEQRAKYIADRIADPNFRADVNVVWRYAVQHLAGEVKP